MFRLSNNIIGVLNLLTFLLSIPILVGGIWLAVRGHTDCEKFLHGPLIALGAFLMAVSLAGFVGACFRISWLLIVYLAVMSILILLFLCFTIFDFAVTDRGSGQGAAGRGFKEYRLEDYSHWLRERVEDGERWGRIRSCLMDGKVCDELKKKKNETYDQFFKEKLSPVESGCCKPPLECGFTYQSATVWTKPATGFKSSNPDCNTWRNDPNVLCYDCQSCKAGTLARTKGDWKKAGIVNCVFLVLLIAVYAVGCRAFQNSRKDNNAFPTWKGSAASA